MIVWAWWRGYQLPSITKILFGFLIGFSLIALIVFALGPIAVFYWFHEQVFPEGHQWFFYYQDSLMTTLMKAPDIFAFIAALLVTVLVALWSAALYGINALLKPAK